MSFPSPDVAVVGAGIIGASIGWRLAQKGARVLLFDAGAWGAEASSAGAGMLAPGGEFDRPTAWSELALASLRTYADYVAELSSETGLVIDYRCCGGLDIARDEREAAALDKRALSQYAFGIRSEPLDTAGCRALVPSLSTEPAGGVYYPDDALVDPTDVLRALKAACLARGAAIREFSPVGRLRIGAQSVEVDIQNETMSAGSAVLAAGAWSSLIPVFAAGERVALAESFPVKGHLAGFSLAPGTLRPILRQDHTYILQRSSGLLIAGSSMEHVGFDRGIDPHVAEDIQHRAAALLAGLPPTPARVWAGFRPATASAEPQVGRLADTHVWLAYGHFRNGILLAPITAARVAGEITASSETIPAWPSCIPR